MYIIPKQQPMSQMCLQVCQHDDHKMESKIDYIEACMDEYNMAPVRKIKTHKIYIHVSQNCSDYKLITMYIHKNSTNYFSSVKSSYRMYLRLYLSGNWSKTCTNINLCSYGQSLQNQIKRTYEHMLLNSSSNVHFYSIIQSAYHMRDANVYRSQKKTILPPKRNSIIHPLLFENQHTLIQLIQLHMYVESKKLCTLFKF